MKPTETVDLVIVGSGPAGASTALHLLRADPRWAGRMVVLDRETHPRDKLCGGGVTRSAEEVLAGLGLGLDPGRGSAPPSVPITELRLVFGERGYGLYGEPVFRVVRRRDFDAWLAGRARAEGVELREGEAVVGLEADAGSLRVVTERTVYRARAVVGADGSKGVVRRSLGWRSGARQARLLEVLTPERPAGGAGPGGWRGVAVFDFTPLAAGLRGYYWDFPSLVAGRPMMNRGVFDSRVASRGPRVPLKEVLAERLALRGRRLDELRLAGHPLQWFEPGAQVAAERVVLAGDAAGVDPLLGEGISFALAHGRVAAAAVAEAFARDDFAFRGYRERLLADPLLAQLDRRRRLARAVYAPGGRRLVGAGWSLVPWAVRTIERWRPGLFPMAAPRFEPLRGLDPEVLRAGA